ncbi:MAG: sigma-54-dependent Fis family transcriptional regulator, partial [Acidobacteria bacterium]|nr:sigma-54-dependent Fis family transcriptional regulator [Acidobacteriota bacterium]
MAHLLIVDDEQGIRQLLTLVFERAGHRVRVAEGGRRALELLRAESVDLIISDVKMPDMNGIELLRAAREVAPDLAVVMMTAFATVDTAREAFKLGADDFIQKPFDVDELKLIVAKALEKLDLVKENRAFRRAQRERGSLGNIIGRSARMQAVYQMIETVAEVQSTVLVTGESGTGKELVARAIHDLSPRAEKPFISINCGAFTETLLESELFGYV